MLQNVPEKEQDVGGKSKLEGYKRHRKVAGGPRKYGEPSHVLQHNFFHCNEEETCSI